MLLFGGSRLVDFSLLVLDRALLTRYRKLSISMTLFPGSLQNLGVTAPLS